MATTAGQVGEALTQAFDFKAIGASMGEFATGAMGALSRVMENLTAIAGALVAGALIPLALQLKAGYTALMAFVAANQAAVAAMTASQIAASAWRATLAVLAGPTGWILAAVGALALFWKEEDKVKTATEALKGSTEEFTQALKAQTETANKLALIKLNEGMAALQEQADKSTAAYNRMNGRLGETVLVYDEVSGVAKLVEVTEKSLLEQRLKMEGGTRLVNEAEKRRGLILEELKAKQEAANPANKAAEEALGKYRKAVDEATEAQEKARAELDKLTPGTYDYGTAAGKAALADLNLKLAKEVLTKAESDYNAEIQRTLRELPQATEKVDDHAKKIRAGIAELEQGVAAAKKYSDAVQDVADAQSDGIRAEIALAEAKGDTAKVQELTRKLAIQEVNASVRVAKAKEAEQAMEYALAVAKLNQVKALREKNQATDEDLALAELTVQKELAEAQAAGTNAQAQEVLAQKLREVNAAKGGASAASDGNTEATQQNTEAQGENVKTVESAIVLYKGLLAALDGARNRMSELSDTAGAYFEAVLQGTLNQYGLMGAFESSGQAMNAYLNAIEGAAGSTGELAKFEQAQS